MSTGFKVRPSQHPAPPAVLAGESQETCGASPAEKGTGAYCERPAGHEGGHLSQSHGRYWQAGEQS
jgi:hypothetical protein